MSNEKYLFQENAFGEMYEDTFFADDFPKLPPKNSKIENSAEAAEISAATSSVRLSTESETRQQAAKAINSACDLGGNLGGGSFHNFSGQIFGGI